MSSTCATIELVEVKRYLRRHFPTVSGQESTKFNCIYFDIWPGICTDNLREVVRLYQVFKNYKTRQRLDGLFGAMTS